ncbi:NIF-domain-containing protein [Tricholoma matsutake]|nr:NIF-domain-containing protein [Tricholoma matsutake 945]
MNSLAYLSRQFDVLASSKTPPSTPSAEHSSFINDRRTHSTSDPPLQRVNTWSTKSILFPPSSSLTGIRPKRSFSTPAFAASLQHLAAPSSPIPEAQPLSKPHIENLVRRIFFIRVFVLVWDNLRTAWSSLVRTEKLVIQPFATAAGKEPEVEKGNKDDEHTCNVSDSTRCPVTIPTPTAQPQRSAANSLTPPLGPAVVMRASESPISASRSSTPVLATRKTPFPLPKTLVLDLDETLIHSTSRPMTYAGSGSSGFFGLGSFDSRNKGVSHTVEVVMGGRSTLYHVYKRPFVDFFLRTVSSWYTLVIFTASMQEYADPVIDWLDAGRGILAHRLFRDSCTQLPNGSYTKDLSVVDPDLSRVCLVDNSPISYRVNEANGIPIEGWTHDPSDEALLDLLPVLDSLRFTSDVRRVLGLRSAGVLT